VCLKCTVLFSSVQTVKDSKANLTDQFIKTPLQNTLQLLSIHSAFSLPFRVLRTFYHQPDQKFLLRFDKIRIRIFLECFHHPN